MASSPCHGAIRNFIHPINAELFLEVTFSTWLQILEFFFKAKLTAHQEEENHFSQLM